MKESKKSEKCLQSNISKFQQLFVVENICKIMNFNFYLHFYSSVNIENSFAAHQLFSTNNSKLCKEKLEFRLYLFIFGTSFWRQVWECDTDLKVICQSGNDSILRSSKNILAFYYLHGFPVQEHLPLKVQNSFGVITFRTRRIVFIRFVASPLNNCSTSQPVNLKYSNKVSVIELPDRHSHCSCRKRHHLQRKTVACFFLFVSKYTRCSNRKLKDNFCKTNVRRYFSGKCL